MTKLYDLETPIHIAVSDVLKSSGDKLTFGEIFAALSLTMASWAKSLRKDEREESQQ